MGIFGYSYYVYVVRLCIPMIRMDSDRLGGRAQGSESISLSTLRMLRLTSAGSTINSRLFGYFPFTLRSLLLELSRRYLDSTWFRSRCTYEAKGSQSRLELI